MTPSLEQIRKDVLASYGSMESPNWAFVGEQHDKAPYAGTLKALQALAQIKDETDFNDDVGLWLKLSFSSASQPDCGLCLSYVGPYAVLYRYGNPCLILTLQTEDLSASEESVLRLLGSLDLLVLDDDLLQMPFPMQGLFCNDDPKDVRLFHVLFADGYGTPGHWESGTVGVP